MERVLEEGESIGELLELCRGGLGAPGGGHPAAGAWLHGVLGEVVKGSKTSGKCHGSNPHPEVISGACMLLVERMDTR